MYHINNKGAIIKNKDYVYMAAPRRLAVREIRSRSPIEQCSEGHQLGGARFPSVRYLFQVGFPAVILILSFQQIHCLFCTDSLDVGSATVA